MSRLFLAFACFIRVLFGKKLPPGAMAYLPEGATPSLPAPKPVEKPAPRAEAARSAGDGKERPVKEAAAKEAAAKEAAAKEAAAKEAAVKAKIEAEKPRASAAQHHREGALALLALLQREGRLVDFLREPLDGFSDADIG